MTPEEKSRQQIDKLLEAAGWRVQDKTDLNLSAGLGVAVREWAFTNGEVDYLLFVNRKPVGIVEAKPEGTTLSGVAEQTFKYLQGTPLNIPAVTYKLPFAYESTGVETFFRDSRDPEARSRRVFAFHKPETLGEWIKTFETLRNRLRHVPPLITGGLRDCQIEAITELEKSFAAAKPRALIQMTMGSGKTYTAVSFVYRLIKYADARKVLFLVDRRTLGRQTMREFEQYVTPDDGRKFMELYNVQHLTSNTIDSVSRVCVTTIQRLYSMLRGEAEYAGENEDASLEEIAPANARPLDVAYNPRLPIEMFDFIVTDECHRSIYNLWRQALEYFDAFTVGLTATPSKQTLGYFNQNLVTEYSHERAVGDGVNVGYEVYRIDTEATKRGGTVEAGFYVDKRDRQTRRVRWEELDKELSYEAAQLDRDVVVPDQIRKVIQTYKDRLFTEMFPGRTVVPKTLIFAKDDSHAEDIVNIVREVFGKGNDFCKKITYRTTGETPENLIAQFRNSYDPRIVVTVDMIATGTDIKPLECLMFMRDVKSSTYFEQMKGRGTRTISATDLQNVTGDAEHKTHFLIVDAVGVCENDKTDSRPLERKKSVPFGKLLESIALGARDEATISSFAGRLARLDRALDKEARSEIEQAAGGTPLRTLINYLLTAIDPDAHEASARIMFETDVPTGEQIASAAEAMIDEACRPFDAPELRRKITEVKQRNEQTIDTVTRDVVTFAGFDTQARERARGVVETFKKFIEDNRHELTALQIIYNQPHGKRRLTYEAIEQLARAIERPPYNLHAQAVWDAYEQLESSRVARSTESGVAAHKMLTNIVALLMFAIGESERLEPYAETVGRKFDEWLKEQARAGRAFTREQSEWLRMITAHIAATLSIRMEDFDLAPFHEHGGAFRVNQLFGAELPRVLDELNEALAA